MAFDVIDVRRATSVYVIMLTMATTTEQRNVVVKYNFDDRAAVHLTTTDGPRGHYTASGSFTSATATTLAAYATYFDLNEYGNLIAGCLVIVATVIFVTCIVCAVQRRVKLRYKTDEPLLPIYEQPFTLSIADEKKLRPLFQP